MSSKTYTPYLAVFTLMPGPMVVVRTQDFRYWPFAAAGFALTIAPISVSKFSLQLFSAERDLTDWAVDDIGFVEAVLDLTGLCLGNSFRNVRGDCAGLRRTASSRAGQGFYQDGRQRPSYPGLQ